MDVDVEFDEATTIQMYCLHDFETEIQFQLHFLSISRFH